MSKNLSANIIKKIKKDNTKKDYERYENLSKEEKKSNNMVVNATKISHKMKNRSLLGIVKSVIKREKMPYYNYKKVFWFIKFCFFIRKRIKIF